MMVNVYAGAGSVHQGTLPELEWLLVHASSLVNNFEEKLSVKLASIRVSD